MCKQLYSSNHKCCGMCKNIRQHRIYNFYSCILEKGSGFDYHLMACDSFKRRLLWKFIPIKKMTKKEYLEFIHY